MRVKFLPFEQFEISTVFLSMKKFEIVKLFTIKVWI